MTNKNSNDKQVLIGQTIDYPTELVLFIKNIFDLEKKVQVATGSCMIYGLF